MLVTCNVLNNFGQRCHYNVDGYCTARAININNTGMCDYVMIRNNINPDIFQPLSDEYKDLNAVPREEDMSPIIEEEVYQKPRSHVKRNSLGKRTRLSRPSKKAAKNT